MLCDRTTEGKKLMNPHCLAVGFVATLQVYALAAMAGDVHRLSFNSDRGDYEALCTFREAVGVRGIRFRSSVEYDAIVESCREESRQQRERMLIAALQQVAKFAAEHPGSETAIRAEEAVKAAGYRAWQGEIVPAGAFVSGATVLTR